jgi:GT2 family glycosyltransferase
MSLDPVSIVIPNYNGEQIIGASLDAVTSAAAAYGGDCEVILVDDASTDRSVEIVSAVHPAVRLVRHAVNQGFSEAARSGVSAARHDRIILLNSDVRPDPHFIAPLVAALDDESVFAASPLVTDAAGNPQFVSWTRYRIVRGKLKARSWRLEDAEARRAQGLPLQGLYASGGSMAFRRERFLALGGFLDIYKPFYSEDLDLGTRAWMRGWKTIFVPESRLVHDGTGTIKRFFAARRVRTIRIRNRLIFFCLYADPLRLFFSYIPWNLMRILTRLLSLDPTMLAAFSQLLRMGHAVAALRARIQADQPNASIERLLQVVNGDMTSGESKTSTGRR